MNALIVKIFHSWRRDWMSHMSFILFLFNRVRSEEVSACWENEISFWENAQPVSYGTLCGETSVNPSVTSPIHLWRYCTSLYFTVLHCPSLYFTILLCTSLYFFPVWRIIEVWVLQGAKWSNQEEKKTFGKWKKKRKLRFDWLEWERENSR